MDRASLEQLLAQGLSLAEIGRRVGRHEATVSYWLKKYGLEAVNHAKHNLKGGLTRDDLSELVDAGMSIAEIAEAVGRSKATVRHWLARYEMRTSGGIGRRSADSTRAAREAGLVEAIVACPRHGQVIHVRDSRGYFRCRQCRQEAVVRRRRKVKQILVEEAGGRCRLCAYDRCVAVLEFHHLDPSAKEFGVAQNGMARSIERLRAEIRKCVLLCSNCHAEVECGFISISGVARVDSPG
jgi:transposase